MSKNNSNGKKSALPNKPTTQQRTLESINRMKKKQINGRPEKTICLTMIVRNEEKNMIRLLDSVKPIIDCGSIVDTGSTDKTVEVIKKWSKDNNVKIEVHSEPFRNFGYNRTHSFIMAKQTFPDIDYALLSDADFVWKIDVVHKFDKRLLIDDVYSIEQYSNNMNYANIRLLSMKLDFVCKLRTHEYWREGDNVYKEKVIKTTINTLKIHDREDGGCKADKFERDERLLLEDIADPENSKEDVIRAKYYLGQTYRCLKNYEESIKWYQQRIANGGWVEETFHAIYQVGFCHEKLGWQIKHCMTLLDKYKCISMKDFLEKCNVSLELSLELKEEKMSDIEYMAKWNKEELSKEELSKRSLVYFADAAKFYKAAYEYRPTRAESLYACAKMYQELNTDEMRKIACEIAMIGNKIPMTKDTFFVEPDCYDYLFDNTLSICAWYIPEFRDEGREAIARLLDHDSLPDNVEKQVKVNSRHYM